MKILRRRASQLASGTLLFAAVLAGSAAASTPADQEVWLPLFNGRNLSDWTPKITHHDRENFGNTFRVEDGLLKVRYDRYKTFDGQFGHLFYKTPFSYYRLVVEYRFVGEPLHTRHRGCLSGHRLTDDPEKRAIGGTSSGAICAFTVAWQRPDAFRKVISLIGSYTSIGYRPAADGELMKPGGDLYPTLIRKNPIKPIRVFLQDGSADLSNEVWRDGAHSDAHGGAILPDVLRWLWR